MNEYLIKNVNIIDGTRNMEVKEGFDILVRNGIIEKIGKDIAFEGNIINKRNTYVMPGLINMHVHLPGSGKVGGKKVADLKSLISFIKSNPITKEIAVMIEHKGAMLELLSGVTTVRSVGGIGNCDSILAKRVAKGKTDGPRIMAANEAICAPGGHMEGTVSRAAPTVEDAVGMVEEIAGSGADLIKLMITGGVLDCKVVGHPGDLKMSKEMVSACCRKAHELGLKVAAHVEGPEGMEIAAECGVDTIEHGAKASEMVFEYLQDHNSALICTLSPAIPLSKIDPSKTGYGEECTINTNVLLEGMIETVNKCLKKSIPVGLGTDTGCPFVTHYDMWRELVYYTNYIDGVDNRFAIHTATAINAKILGLDNEVGTIEEGKSADLLFVKDNPLDDLKTLREPLLVIARGKIFEAKNKKYLEIDKELDALI